MSFAKNGHPGGKLTWITLQRMVQLVWYIWCKVAKKMSQSAPRTNLSTVVGDAENEGERNKTKDPTTWQHCAAFLLSCGFISTPRNQIHDGSRDWNVRCKGVGLILVNLPRGGSLKACCYCPRLLLNFLSSWWAVRRRTQEHGEEDYLEAAWLLGRANGKEREDDLEECVWTAKEGRLNKFNYPN